MNTTSRTANESGQGKRERAPGRWERVRQKVGLQWEIYLLLAVFGVWYAMNLRGGLFVDEVAYARTGWDFFHGAPYSNPTHIFAPTGKYPIGVGQLVFGTTTLGVRLPVLLFGLSTLYVTYRLGVLLAGRLVGASAVVLLGLAPVFARHSVMGMLDVPLAFFVVSLTYVTVRWIQDGSPRYAAAVGVLAVAVVTTKAYAFMFAFPVLVATVLVAFARAESTGVRATLKQVVLGVRFHVGAAVGTLSILYLPFFVYPHPPVPEGTLPTAFGGLLAQIMSLPVLGNFAYVFGAAVYVNLAHLGGGHAVAVGPTVYQYPPAWSYLYWLYETGLVYALALVLVVASTLKHALERDLRWPLLLDVGVLVPLVGLSAMTVKFPRYMLPLLPLLVVVGAAWGYRVAAVTLEALSSTGTGTGSSGRVVAGLFVVALVGASVVPPSPIAPAAAEGIRTDSGFDRVAAFVGGCAVDDPDEDTVVLAYHLSALQYYSAPRDDVTYVGYTPTDAANDTKYRAIRNRIESGEIDLVVTVEDNRRIRELQPELYRQIRTDGTRLFSATQSPSGELVVYGFGDVQC